MKRNAVWPAQTTATTGWSSEELQVDGVGDLELADDD